MFDAFRKFLSDCMAGDKHPGRFEDNDYRLAASALLVHAAAIDGEMSPVARASLINRSLDEEGRRRVVEMMWEIAYADGHVSEFEDNLLWRAADLLGVSARERIELRRQVAGARARREGS